MPNLNVESRLAMEGRLEDPGKLVEEIVVPRVREGLARNEIYGEKNVTYGPFIPHLHELTGCKFILLRRDGRDVVRSLMDWHDRMFGNVFRGCADPGDLSQGAVNAIAARGQGPSSGAGPRSASVFDRAVELMMPADSAWA